MHVCVPCACRSPQRSVGELNQLELELQIVGSLCGVLEMEPKFTARTIIAEASLQSVCLIFETGYHYIDWAGFELIEICLPRSPGCCD